MRIYSVGATRAMFEALAAAPRGQLTTSDLVPVWTSFYPCDRPTALRRVRRAMLLHIREGNVRQAETRPVTVWQITRLGRLALK